MATGSSQVSGRILLDIPCKVCHDHSSGKHYGIFACDGCAGFFKRSIRRNRQYVCKNRGTGTEGTCMVDKTHRNQCRACRLTKCAQVGMNKDAVQHERGPRNSTLRRQMALYFKENTMGPTPQTPTEPTNPFEGRPQGLGINLSSTPFGGLLPPTHLGFAPGPNPFSPFWPPPFLTPLNGGMVGFPTELKIPPPNFTAPLFVATSVSSSSTTSPQININKGPPSSEGSSSDAASSATNSTPDNTIKEQAARLLFLTLNWPKSLPPFLSLPHNEQLSILRESWPELFLLSACQFRFFTEETLCKLGSELRESEERGALDRLKLAVSQLELIAPDPVELSCLRAFTLLKSAPQSSIEQIQLTLTRYEAIQHSTQPLRSVKLLMLLPTLRAVSAATLEKLFFKDSIGEVPMSRLVCDLYTASSNVLANLPTSSHSQTPLMASTGLLKPSTPISTPSSISIS